MDDLKFKELRSANVERCERHYHPIAAWRLSDWLMAVTGELGELANVIKHMRRGEDVGPTRTDGMLHRDELAEEAADVVVYLDLLCAHAGIDLGEAVRAKFNLVSKERLNSPILLRTPYAGLKCKWCNRSFIGKVRCNVVRCRDPENCGVGSYQCGCQDMSGLCEAVG